MQTTLTWTDPINWLIVLLLLALLASQVWLIVRSQSLSSSRKWVRFGLNLLLWLVVAAYFLQIRWSVTKPATHALLVGDNVPSAFANRVKDSLHIQDSFSGSRFKPNYDSVTLVGQRFPTETLTQLSNASVQWMPYDQPDQLQTIHWKGLIRQGEMQRVSGQIWSSEKQALRLRFGNQTLDSVGLTKGANSFTLQFPAFAQGRNQVELLLGRATTLDTLRFFTQRTEPLTVQFLLNSPDFESKTLANWLGKHGHTVQLTATLSKDINSNISINKAGKSANKIADLLITEPANANNASIRKAVADGKTVLFINLTNPETDCQTINRALGSRWQVRKTSNEPAVPIGHGLTALPYRFFNSLNQFTVSGYPVAVQQTSGRVGISLLSETYPLTLSGDSITYNQLWTAVLARLSRSEKNTVQIESPLYSGIQQSIRINNPGKQLRTLTIGQDTVPIVYSPINERTIAGHSLFRQSGWQTIQDSLAMYVEPVNAPLRDRQIISRFVQAHAQHHSIVERQDRSITQQLPDWVWLALLLSCFTALWIEPKLV